MVVRRSAEDARGLAAVVTGASTRSPPLLVSGEAFAALAVARELPRPPDPQLFRGVHGDEPLVREVQSEVASLVAEHRTLLELYRRLRREFMDFGRGAAQPPSGCLVRPPPDGVRTLAALGRGLGVPPCLRHEGLLPLRPLTQQEVFGVCTRLWARRTEELTDNVHANLSQVPLHDFLGKASLWAADGTSDVELMSTRYNFFLSLREHTSVATGESTEAACEAHSTSSRTLGLKVTILGAEGLDAGSSSRPSPYCLGQVIGRPGSAVQTEPLAETADPAWNRTFELADYCQGDALSFTILDADAKRRGMSLGTATVAGDELESAADRGAPLKLALADSSAKAVLRVQIASWVSVPAADAFSAESEVLYRSMLGQMDEGMYHDQTAMLVAFVQMLRLLAERPPTREPQAEGERALRLSSIIELARSFFPNKSREHVKLLRQLLEELPRSSPTTRLAAPAAAAGSPGLIDLDKLLGFRAGASGGLAADLVASRAPLLLELRRQHLVEARCFLDRVDAALKREASGGCVTAQQVDAALRTADETLTEDLSYLYTVRGFTQWPPDTAAWLQAKEGATEEPRSPLGGLSPFGGMSPRGARSPSAGRGVADTGAQRSAAEGAGQWQGRRFQKHAAAKLRLLLRERYRALCDQGTRVPVDDFVDRIASSGVARAASAWKTDEVCMNALQNLLRRSRRAVLIAADSQDVSVPGSGQESQHLAGPPMTSTRISGSSTEQVDQLEAFKKHALAADDSQDVSLVCPHLAILHWLAAERIVRPV